MNHIKLPITFFDGDKIKAIRSQKDGDSVILLYTMLITAAVKSNSDGLLMLCNDIPYDDKILSDILNLPLAVVKSGLELLVKFGLITIENNIFSLVNYDEYADIKTVKERKQNAERQARFKAKQADSTVTITPKKAVKSTDILENAEDLSYRFHTVGVASVLFVIHFRVCKQYPAPQRLVFIK